MARTPADFLVAARSVPPLLNASAISGEYLSAASFLGVAGLAMLDGLGALWYAVGYAGGTWSCSPPSLRRCAASGPTRSPSSPRAGSSSAPAAAGGHGDGPRDLRLLPAAPAKRSGHNPAGGPGRSYWLGVVALGMVVTLGIASGGMKGITVVQAFQFWLKLTAIAVPALFPAHLLPPPTVQFAASAGAAHFRHAPPPSSSRDREQVDVQSPVTVGRTVWSTGYPATGSCAWLPAVPGSAPGSSLRFPAGAQGPHVGHHRPAQHQQWESPLVRIDGGADHPLAATYGVVLATFLGAFGLPHILVRFYTNPDGPAARGQPPSFLLLGLFLRFPGHFAALGRLDAPQLYTSGQTDSVVLALPRLAASGALGAALAALRPPGPSPPSCPPRRAY